MILTAHSVTALLCPFLKGDGWADYFIYSFIFTKYVRSLFVVYLRLMAGDGV